MRFAPSLLGLLLAACAGSGDGLDENGRPLDESPPAAPAPASDFQTIQDEVFTPICTGCHAGAGAPLGLRLEQGLSYDMLVGVPSAEVPALPRVAPGDPDGSYLLQKIEGTAAVGARMPLGGPPLAAEWIAAIRQWIVDGARPPAGAAGEAPAGVRSAFTLKDGVQIAFTRELDASSVHSASVELQHADGRPVSAAVSARAAPANPRAVRLALRPERLPAGRYRLLVRGTGGAPLADLRGLPIDGDGDGRPGGDYVFPFALEDLP